MSSPEEFRGDTFIDTEGLQKAKVRHEAIKAVKAGTATAEQMRLVEDADRVMQEAMKLRRR